MSKQPLRIAVTMLSIAIGLTIALATSGSLLSGRSGDFIASSKGGLSGNADKASSTTPAEQISQSTNSANRTTAGDRLAMTETIPHSSQYPREDAGDSNTSRPFPTGLDGTTTGSTAYFPEPQPLVSADQTPLLRNVITDLPHGPANGPFVRASSSQGGKPGADPYPARLGYEELPPPPHSTEIDRIAAATGREGGPVTLSPRIDFHDPQTNTSTPYPPSLGVAREPQQQPLGRDQFGELQAQIVSLRGELQQVTKTGLSQELEEIQRLRELLHELQSLRQLSDLQAEVQRLAQRQASLESTVDEQSKSASNPPVPSTSPMPELPATATPAPATPAPATDVKSDPSSQSDPAVEAEPERVELKATPRNAGHWNLRLRGASIAEALDRLCVESHWNAAVGPGVEGIVNLSLTGVTLEEAIQGVAKAVGCEVLEDGNLRMLVPAGVAEARRRAARQPIAKIIPLSHIAAIDVAPLVTPLLTPQLGEVGITSPGTDVEQSGSPRRAIPDALVVVDYGDAVTQIEALIAELDVPPPEVEIEAVIMRVRRNEKTPLGVMAALRTALQPGELIERFPGGQSMAQGTACDSVECVPYRGNPQRLRRSLELLAATSVTATPHIRVLNRQTAEIAVGENIGYRSHTVWRGRRTPKEQEVDLLEAITRLKVTPYIRPDGTIRVQVHPYHSHVVIDPKTDLPRQQTAEALTDVTLSDGCTLIIGGLISHTDEFVNNSRGPINFLKRKLRRASGEEYDDEIVIMLTPRLVDPMQVWESVPDEFAPMPAAAPVVSRLAPAYKPTESLPAIVPVAASLAQPQVQPREAPQSGVANHPDFFGRSMKQGFTIAAPPEPSDSTPAPVPPPPMTFPPVASHPITPVSAREDSTSNSGVSHAAWLPPVMAETGPLTSTDDTTVPGPPTARESQTASPTASRATSHPPGSIRLRTR